MEKLLILIILALISINIAIAQSIGATPENTVETEINTLTTTSFSVSQGAEYPELITIEGEYKWLNIAERQFILESKTGKRVNLTIDIKKPGIYKADLRVCGAPVTAEGAVLAVKACTHHKLTVTATGKKEIKNEMIIITAVILLAIAIYLTVKLRKKRKH